jgi:hypothetical protein
MTPTTQERAPNREPTSAREVLVPDSRARLTPAQMVEHKLVALLKRLPLPVSCTQTARRRGPQ